MYVPPLPEKLVIDNTSQETIAERTFLLNEFIKYIAMTPYLVESPEFLIFAGLEGNLEDLSVILKKDRMKCLGLISRIEPYYFIEGTFPEQTLDTAKTLIAKFHGIAKRMQIFLAKLINYTVENEKKFDVNRKRYTNLNKYFYEYERLSVDCYS